jgi:hypothetical protein
MGQSGTRKKHGAAAAQSRTGDSWSFDRPLPEYAIDQSAQQSFVLLPLHSVLKTFQELHQTTLAYRVYRQPL